MSGSRLTLRLLAGTALLAALPIRAADAPASPALLQPVANTTTITSLDPAIAPAEYKAQQDNAPEEVVLRVTAVKPTPAKAEDANIGPDAKAVAVRAVILNVLRSKTNLKIGSVIYLLYGYAPPAPGKPGPPPVPIVVINTDYHAFLNGGPGDTAYHPAAGAQSFLDPKALVAASAAPATPTDPLPDPTLFPTPINPKPKGSVHLTGDNLAQFVALVQTGDQWGASIAHADPLPLQTQGAEPPVLMGFYGKPLGAPATQPTLLIYRSAVLPAPPPATGTVTLVRALIVDHNNRPLGDAPWARVLSDDSQAPLLPPVWAWSAYKVDITDPDTQQVQTILLTAPNP
jgi:hypothetical protein